MPTTATAELLAPGAVVGGCYEIVRLIGAGAMAEVYEARDRLLNRVVALKAARRDTLARSLLRKEAQALGALRHPAIVTVHGMGFHADLAFLVMERIHGQSLASLLEREGRLGFPEAVNLLVRIAEGLVAVHAAGIAHRDIKPDNMMLAGGGRVVLMDLGIFNAEFEERQELITGTPQYMAPETILNQIAPGAWHLVDLYALGIVAYELVTGRPPFDSEHVGDVLEGHVYGVVPEIAGAPAALVALIHELLAKDPRDRLPTAEAALWRLRALQRDLAPLARPPRSILIVDDDPDAVDLIAAALHRVLGDPEIATAGSAGEAIAELRRHTPDLILLDVQMPEMNGLELCMFLRGAELAPNCPIIGVSGSIDDADVAVLRRLGVRHFVRKGPTMVERLGGAIRALCAGQR